MADRKGVGYYLERDGQLIEVKHKVTDGKDFYSARFVNPREFLFPGEREKNAYVFNTKGRDLANNVAERLNDPRPGYGL